MARPIADLKMLFVFAAIRRRKGGTRDHEWPFWDDQDSRPRWAPERPETPPKSII